MSIACHTQTSLKYNFPVNSYKPGQVFFQLETLLTQKTEDVCSGLPLSRKIPGKREFCFV